ncbi:PTS sugar transporter subunit IIC, partial [Staphylococcus equorum]
VWMLILVFHILLPAAISFSLYKLCLNKQWIKPGDQLIHIAN